MKRKGNLYQRVYSLENLKEATGNALKGKSKQYGVKLFLKDSEAKITELHEMLKNKTYRTSEYTRFTIFEPKEREIFRLPFFPDRIAHHAVMNVLEDMFVSTFTANTYSCIKGRGIHAASKAIKKALEDVPGTQYCLKLDIKKFYPSIDHDILKSRLRRKIKDKDLLWLLDEIVESAEGLPIGNYLSQYFANFYLAYFDHWIKEVKGVKYYFRYADDLVILSDDKQFLHQLLSDITGYLNDELKLTVKENYQVFPVAKRGVDFLGYKFFHTHVLLRKGIKTRFRKMVFKNRNKASVASYSGWTKHCNGKHLMKKLLYE